MERVKGIEPSQSAWKADVLPLNYTRLNAPQISLSKSDFDIIHTPFVVVNTILKFLFDTYFAAEYNFCIRNFRSDIL